VLDGVWGGVVSGSGGGCAEFVAVTSGTEPRVGVGLFTTPAGGGCEDWVAIEFVELDRAGLAGGAVAVFPDTWAFAGEGACVGVGRGVMFVDAVPVVELFWAVEFGPVGPVYGCPSSPGANESVEQNPSEELMSNVKPSVDLRYVRDIRTVGVWRNVPGQISERSEMQIADNGQWSLLLRIIH
jgi:hypothetical protein